MRPGAISMVATIANFGLDRSFSPFAACCACALKGKAEPVAARTAQMCRRLILGSSSSSLCGVEHHIGKLYHYRPARWTDECMAILLALSTEGYIDQVRRVKRRKAGNLTFVLSYRGGTEGWASLVP